MDNQQNNGRLIALLPMGVFLVIFLGAGILTGDFYSMPTILAFLIALFVAFLQNRGLDFNKKISVIAKGISDDNIITMCLIFLCAGGFSGVVTATGGAESTVNLGLTFLPTQIIVVGLFIIGCFVSISMGTSMGTIAALAPIAVQVSKKTGFEIAVCIAAVVCGAMFGDNLSMISDTTIAAVKTQGAQMKDKFRQNFLIVLPAAIVTAIIFFLLTRSGAPNMNLDLKFNFWLVLPYILVLVGALIGINVFLVLIGGTVASILAGVLTGSLSFWKCVAAVGTGINGMYDITVISIIVACIVALIKEYGGIDFIINIFKKHIKGNKGAQLGIGFLTLIVDACTANNTVAIIITGPLAKNISNEFGVTAKKSASLLDIFASVGQGLIPYGAQLLSAAALATSLSKVKITPYQIIPNMYYPVLMAISAVLFIVFTKKKKNEMKS
ncbi:MAG: Na+/H+ antiporter NhaC family protein [Lachnospiraceae bacterium]|nr:Na+/H+ antiporter NhaC family protein [Lachnospiraceae bacterium]